MALPLANVNSVGIYIYGDNEERLLVPPNIQPSALTYCIELRALVHSNNLSLLWGIYGRSREPLQLLKRYGRILCRPGRVGVCKLSALRLGEDPLLRLGKYLHHISLLRLKLLLQENWQVHFANKADSLRILSGSAWQPCLCSQSAHLRLWQITYREESPGELFLTQLAEKIALILIFVRAGNKAVEFASTAIQILLLSAIVPCGNIVCSKGNRLLQKGIKLYLSVAKHIGIRSSAVLVLIKHIVHHPFAVYIAQIHKVEGYSNLFGHHFC